LFPASFADLKNDFVALQPAGFFISQGLIGIACFRRKDPPVGVRGIPELAGPLERFGSF